MRRKPVTFKASNKLKDYAGIFAIAFFIFVLYSFFGAYSNIKEANLRIDEARKELEQLESVNKDLKIKVEEVLSDQYLEYQARDGLGMSREGEVVMVLPNEEEIKKLVPDIAEFEEREPEKRVYWRDWLELFNF